MSPRVRASRERGFALLGCALLLGIVSVLGVATLAGAVIDLRLASNVVHRDRAFQAAEYAIDAALDEGSFTTSLTLPSPRRIPAAVDEYLEIPGSGGDAFRYDLYFLGSTPTTPPLPAEIAAFHFVVEATGRSARGASDTHVQGFYVLRPTGWTSDEGFAACDPSDSECVPEPVGGPTPTHWRQTQTE